MHQQQQKKSDYLALIDANEFIVLKQHKSLRGMNETILGPVHPPIKQLIAYKTLLKMCGERLIWEDAEHCY
jgi:hypothetical protein